MARSFKAVLFDVDGTLVDSNDAHADAWVKAFTKHGVTVDWARVRRCVGMGGDKLMPEVSGLEEESPEGAAIAKDRGAIFTRDFLPSVTPLRGSDQLVAALEALGYTMVAASSAKEDELAALLKIAGVASLMDAATSSDDAEASKPEPDIVHAALKHAKVKAAEAVMIGDTPYDVEAATRAGVKIIGFRSGGWGDADLKGAIAIYDGPWDLLDRLDASPLACG
jgi:HAD superfamily hydrolase (TIGR01509 family)